MIRVVLQSRELHSGKFAVSGEPFFGRKLDVEAANKSIDRESKPGDKLAYASIDMQNQ